ncbi:MAG TPA: T9SS type A sorting domain-containing protein, partial [Candidatus Kapabacteria bacterium]
GIQGAYIIDTVYYTGFYAGNCGFGDIHLKHNDSIIYTGLGGPFNPFDTMGISFVIPSWADTGKWDLVIVYGVECNDSETYPGRFTVLPASTSVLPVSNSELSLSAVSNPAGRNITAMVNAPFSASATLELYDALGHVVQALPSARLKPGTNRFTFDCSALPSGNYYLRLSTNGTVKTVNLTIEH